MKILMQLLTLTLFSHALHSMTIPAERVPSNIMFDPYNNVLTLKSISDDEIKSIHSWKLGSSNPKDIKDISDLKLHILASDITYIPEEIGQLDNLVTIKIDNTPNLTKLPSSIGKLKKLEELDIHTSNLTELPEEIGDCTALKSLNMYYSRLKNLPDSFGNLQALEILKLSFNALEQMPHSIGALKNLVILDVSHNNIKDVANIFEGLTHLKQLDISSNQLTQLPDNFGNMTALRSLNLADNQLTQLPDSFDKLVNLETLNLIFNKLTKLPRLYNLKNLTTLDVALNAIEKLPLYPHEALKRINASYNPLAKATIEEDGEEEYWRKQLGEGFTYVRNPIIAVPHKSLVLRSAIYFNEQGLRIEKFVYHVDFDEVSLSDKDMELIPDLILVALDGENVKFSEFFTIRIKNDDDGNEYYSIVAK